MKSLVWHTPKSDHQPDFSMLGGVGSTFMSMIWFTNLLQRLFPDGWIEWERSNWRQDWLTRGLWEWKRWRIQRVMEGRINEKLISQTSEPNIEGSEGEKISEL